MSRVSIATQLSHQYLETAKPEVLSRPGLPDSSMEILALRTVLQEGDPVNGALAGPARIALGMAEIKLARKPTDTIDGAAQLTAGALGTVGGGVGLAGNVAAVAGEAGLNGAGLSNLVHELGGSTLGGFANGAGALVKGSLDLWRGIRHHDRKSEIVGCIKLGCAGLMLAGAACSFPLLVAGGASIYLTTAMVANHQLMTKLELGAGAMTILGTATATPLLVVGGTLAYLAAAAYDNRECLKLLAKQWAHGLTHLHAAPGAA